MPWPCHDDPAMADEWKVCWKTHISWKSHPQKSLCSIHVWKNMIYRYIYICIYIYVYIYGIPSRPYGPNYIGIDPLRNHGLWSCWNTRVTRGWDCCYCHHHQYRYHISYVEKPTIQRSFSREQKCVFPYRCFSLLEATKKLCVESM